MKDARVILFGYDTDVWQSGTDLIRIKGLAQALLGSLANKRQDDQASENQWRTCTPPALLIYRTSGTRSSVDLHWTQSRWPCHPGGSSSPAYIGRLGYFSHASPALFSDSRSNARLSVRHPGRCRRRRANLIRSTTQPRVWSCSEPLISAAASVRCSWSSC